MLCSHRTNVLCQICVCCLSYQKMLVQRCVHKPDQRCVHKPDASDTNSPERGATAFQLHCARQVLAQLRESADLQKKVALRRNTNLKCCIPAQSQIQQSPLDNYNFLIFLDVCSEINPIIHFLSSTFMFSVEINQLQCFSPNAKVGEEAHSPNQQGLTSEPFQLCIP